MLATQTLLILAAALVREATAIIQLGNIEFHNYCDRNLEVRTKDGEFVASLPSSGEPFVEPFRVEKETLVITEKDRAVPAASLQYEVIINNWKSAAIQECKLNGCNKCMSQAAQGRGGNTQAACTTELLESHNIQVEYPCVSDEIKKCDRDADVPPSLDYTLSNGSDGDFLPGQLLRLSSCNPNEWQGLRSGFSETSSCDSAGDDLKLELCANRK